MIRPAEQVVLYWMGELTDEDPADLGMSVMKCTAQFLVVMYVSGESLFLHRCGGC